MNILKLFRKNITQIPLELIAPSRESTRFIYREKEITEIARSIEKHGVLEPIALRRRENGFETVCGEKRIRAAALTGRNEIPARVINFASDAQALLYALIDNRQPSSLHFFEEAFAIYSLIQNHGLSIDTVAGQLNISTESVVEYLSILQLTDAEKTAIINYGLSKNHALVIYGMDNFTDEERISIIKYAASSAFSPAQTVAFVCGTMYAAAM